MSNLKAFPYDYQYLQDLKNDDPKVFAKYKFDVEMAYLEGSEIEYYHAGNKAWEPATPPLFDWYTTMYRVKPQPKMVPLDFTDQLVGKVIVHNKTGTRYSIVRQTEDAISTWSHSIDYDDLMTDYTFLDGTICGKEAK